MSWKRWIIAAVFIFLSMNLAANEQGFTFRPYYGGGGIDLFYHRTGSIYLEVGYLQHYVNNELMGGVSLVIGSRGYFR